jgi:predicted ribosomally synthesized peptide with SipW-like signal peptide
MARKLTAIAAALGLLATLLSLGAWRNHAVPRAVEATQPRALERPRGRHSLAKKLLATVAVLALLVTVISISVLALFTDTASVPANTFTTGTVDISTSPTTALVTYSAMAPGDEVTNPINVSNDGTLDLRYAVTSTTTEDVLAAELDLTIKSGVTTCTNAGFDTDGTVIYTTGDLGSIAGINVIGDPTSGPDAGDRTLVATANEDLCFNVELPLTATNAAQGLTTTATFAFEAEQTKNNP